MIFDRAELEKTIITFMASGTTIIYKSSSPADISLTNRVYSRNGVAEDPWISNKPHP